VGASQEFPITIFQSVERHLWEDFDPVDIVFDAEMAKAVDAQQEKNAKEDESIFKNLEGDGKMGKWSSVSLPEIRGGMVRDRKKSFRRESLL
jgi:hypothetical protein